MMNHKIPNHRTNMIITDPEIVFKKIRPLLGKEVTILIPGYDGGINGILNIFNTYTSTTLKEKSILKVCGLQFQLNQVSRILIESKSRRWITLSPDFDKMSPRDKREKVWEYIDK